jgi:hypothetical protein
MSDAVATMGTILPDDADGRDAVHVAVIVRTAVEKLFPGQDVSKEGTTKGEPIGIVDPFLKGAVFPGQKYWMFLYPRTITSLAHHWSHPAFTTEQTVPESTRIPESQRASSERWLRDFVDRWGCTSYEGLLDAVKQWDGDEYLTIYDSDARGDIPPELWDHVGVVLGRVLPGPRPTYFSCSC